jgi:acetylornithine deacetylase/succinyl-diaminopimelate desuccinylase-like protein
VPGSCAFSLDVRSDSDRRRGELLAAVLAAVERVCRRRGVGWQAETVGDTPAVRMDERVAGALAAACQRLGVPAPSLPSMAGHDAQNLAAIGLPTGMLFVRSTGGSHNPREHADAGDAAQGARALLLACAAL